MFLTPDLQGVYYVPWSLMALSPLVSDRHCRVSEWPLPAYAHVMVHALISAVDSLGPTVVLPLWVQHGREAGFLV